LVIDISLVPFQGIVITAEAVPEGAGLNNTIAGADLFPSSVLLAIELLITACFGWFSHNPAAPTLCQSGSVLVFAGTPAQVWRVAY
jgi:hypothetical protein